MCPEKVFQHGQSPKPDVLVEATYSKGHGVTLSVAAGLRRIIAQKLREAATLVEG